MTFKSSHLREDFTGCSIVHDRLGNRQPFIWHPVSTSRENAMKVLLKLVLEKLAEVYGVSEEKVAET